MIFINSKAYKWLFKKMIAILMSIVIWYSTARLPALDLELDLDDLNLPPKEDIQSDLDISKVIMANLSAEEADLCPDKAAVEPMEVNSSDQAVEQVDPAQTQDQCPASTSPGNTHIYILHVLMVPTVNALFCASTEFP